MGWIFDYYKQCFNKGKEEGKELKKKHKEKIKKKFKKGEEGNGE